MAAGQVKYNCLLQFHLSRNEGRILEDLSSPSLRIGLLSRAIPGLRVNLNTGERMRDVVPRGNEQSYKQRDYNDNRIAREWLCTTLYRALRWSSYGRGNAMRIVRTLAPHCHSPLPPKCGHSVRYMAPFCCNIFLLR